MKRREFLKALTALPIAGPVIAKATPKALPFKPNSAQKLILGELGSTNVIRWRKYEPIKANAEPMPGGKVPDPIRLYGSVMRVPSEWLK